MDDRERNDVERLNRLWDAALSRGPIEPDGDLVQTIAWLHARDDAPEPDPVFLARLRDELLCAGAPETARTPRDAQPLGLVWSPPAARLPRPLRRLAIAAIAAALLVAALSGGGRWLSGAGPAPLVASAMASSVPDRATAVSTSTRIPVVQAIPSAASGLLPTAVPGYLEGASVELPRSATT